MSNATYTPGPWRASLGTLVRVNAGPITICGVHRSGRFTGNHKPHETEANARLIAAAPDYDTAARAYVGWIRRCKDEIPPSLLGAMDAAFGAQLLTAIAKTDGNGDSTASRVSSGIGP